MRPWCGAVHSLAGNGGLLWTFLIFYFGFHNNPLVLVVLELQFFLSVPEHWSHRFSVPNCLNFLDMFRDWCASTFRLFLCLCINEMNKVSRFCWEILSRQCKKKLQSWAHYWSFVHDSHLFWYTPCTELVVIQLLFNNFYWTSPQNLSKIHHKGMIPWIFAFNTRLGRLFERVHQSHLNVVREPARRRHLCAHLWISYTNPSPNCHW